MIKTSLNFVEIQNIGSVLIIIGFQVCGNKKATLLKAA
jgi:hypothetical protein